MHILVTGGAGYIGSHTCVELAAAGYQPVILDSFATSKRSVLARLAKITGRDIELVEGDVRDRAALDRIFATRKYEAVIHFAGLKSVPESVARPLAYYDVNVRGSVTLAEAMAAHGVKTLVFSSSATVYGVPSSVPVAENAPLNPVSPYGRSKRMVEDALRDLAASHPAWRIALLRYFNPAGAHASGMIGDDPLAPPGNLVPALAQVASGRRERLLIFGDDYETADGTGVRDYLHVVDLALGHVSALRYLSREAPGVLTANLGTGRGTSVLEVVQAFERALGRKLPSSVAPRRAGDIACYYADPSLANARLGWRAGRSIDDMCRDAWRWQQWAQANGA